MNSQASFLHRGFTLVEMAIVLAVIGVLAVGLFRIISGSNQQLQNQAAANQQLQLINATKAYLASTAGQNYLIENPNCTGTPDGATGNKLCLPAIAFNLPIANLSAFLPSGFTASTTNSYGQNYTINVLRDSTPNSTLPGVPPATYSFMILANATGVVIPDNSGGAISSQIGSDGGFVYSSNVCGTPIATTACGSFSNWSASVTTTYGFTGTNYSGSIASRTYVAPSQDSTVPWLARSIISNDPSFTFNTMATTLYVPTTLSLTNSSASTLGTFNLAGGTVSGTANIDNTAGMNFNVDTSLGMFLRYKTPTNYTGNNPLLTLIAGCTAASGTTVAGLYQAGCTQEALSITGDEYISGQIFGPASFQMTFSDIRLKKNIQPLNNSISSIMKIKPVSFIYKNSEQKGIGVIAQDVEKIYPELVSERDGYKAVNYDGLIAPLLGAVQELKHENDQLKSRIDILQQKIEDQNQQPKFKSVE